MIPGIVSNCWKTQLAAGESLELLIEEAVRRGYRAVELRQTALGDCEATDDFLPLPDRLARLSLRFPGIRFNLAISLPFFDASVSPAHPLFAAGREAACGLAGQFFPHLRLVDLQTTGDRTQHVDVEQSAASLARLADAMASLAGMLSVENSLQPWDVFAAVVSRARQQMRTDSTQLRICYDAANLILSGDLREADTVTRSLAADELSMVHFKQRREGKSISTVDDGDVDWSAQLAALKTIGYIGPALFEIDSHPQIWHNLESSLRYLQRLGLDV